MLLSRRHLMVSSLAAFAPAPRLKIVITGGHPGDPECGCGGTAARYVGLGHEVALLYLNRGEGYCKGHDPVQCGSVRAAEAEKACQILKSRAVFAGQIDGHAIVDNAHYDEFQRLLAAEKPDVLFAQWPIDSHRDHRAISQLVLDAWLKSGRKAAFFYYEVAGDTLMFSPNQFVDISDPGIESIRREACFAHVSQSPEKWYPEQVAITRWRGSQSGHEQAEGFLRHWESVAGLLP